MRLTSPMMAMYDQQNAVSRNIFLQAWQNRGLINNQIE